MPTMRLDKQGSGQFLIIACKNRECGGTQEGKKLKHGAIGQIAASPVPIAGYDTAADAVHQAAADDL